MSNENAKQENGSDSLDGKTVFEPVGQQSCLDSLDGKTVFEPVGQQSCLDSLDGKTVYGYARCSTDEKRQDINRQKRDLMKMGVTDPENIYWEYESGAKNNRKQLNLLLDLAQPGDTIITTEISRLTRSTLHLCEIIQVIQDRSLCLIAGSFVADCRTEDVDAMTKGMLKMWGVFSEMERDMIRERIKSGVANARAKGVKLGRPKTTMDDLPSDFKKYYKQYKNSELTITQMSKHLMCSRQKVYRYIKTYEEDTSSV